MVVFFSGRPPKSSCAPSRNVCVSVKMVKWPFTKIKDPLVSVSTEMPAIRVTAMKIYRSRLASVTS